MWKFIRVLQEVKIHETLLIKCEYFLHSQNSQVQSPITRLRIDLKLKFTNKIYNSIKLGHTSMSFMLKNIPPERERRERERNWIVIQLILPIARVYKFYK